MNYVDKKKIQEVYIQYYYECISARKKKINPPEVPDYITSSIINIAKGQIRKERWCRMPDTENMVGNAIEKMIIAIIKLKYNPNHKSENLFGYLTKACHNAFNDIQISETNETAIRNRYAHKSLHDTSEEQDEVVETLSGYIERTQDFSDHYVNYLQKKKKTYFKRKKK